MRVSYSPDLSTVEKEVIGLLYTPCFLTTKGNILETANLGHRNPPEGLKNGNKEGLEGFRPLMDFFLQQTNVQTTLLWATQPDHDFSLTSRQYSATDRSQAGSHSMDQQELT